MLVRITPPSTSAGFLKAVQLGHEVGEGPERPEDRGDRQRRGQGRRQRQRHQLDHLDQHHHRVQPHHQRQCVPEPADAAEEPPDPDGQEDHDHERRELHHRADQRPAEDRRTHPVDRTWAEQKRRVAEDDADAGHQHRRLERERRWSAGGDDPARRGARPEQAVGDELTPHVSERHAGRHIRRAPRSRPGPWPRPPRRGPSRRSPRSPPGSPRRSRPRAPRAM